MITPRRPPQRIRVDLTQVVKAAVVKYFGVDIEIKNAIDEIGLFEVYVWGYKFEIYIREIK